jgi:hypothetical protein
MRICCGFLVFSVAVAAATVDSPSIGYMRTVNGAIVRVSGIAGAFVTAATGDSAAVSYGFSGTLGFVKLDASLKVVKDTGETAGEFEAPAGPALFGFNAKGDSGAAYYPATGTLMLLRDNAWTTVPFQVPSGRLAAIAVKDAGHVMAVVRDHEMRVLTVRVSDGATEDASGLGPGGGPAFVSASGTVLFVRDHKLMYRDPQGCQRILATAPEGAAAMAQMGAGWVQIQTASGRNLAVRLEPEPRVYELPEVSQ